MEEYIWSIQAAHRAHGGKPSSGDSGSSGDNYELERLSRQVDRLTLACQALWEIVRDETNISEKDLAEKITEIDLRDGCADGKIGTTPVECKSCGRNSNSRRSSCIWCGEEIERKHAFEG